MADFERDLIKRVRAADTALEKYRKQKKRSPESQTKPSWWRSLDIKTGEIVPIDTPARKRQLIKSLYRQDPEWD